jgi:hypothetical protein
MVQRLFGELVVGIRMRADDHQLDVIILQHIRDIPGVVDALDFFPITLLRIPAIDRFDFDVAS